jgi:GT2 family glycosyltransferase
VISAVVVNFNGEPWLERCLSSLEASPAHDVQIILVDNASTDGSLDLVQRRFPRVDVVRMGHNVGFAVANNIGAACSDGDLLLFLNNDAWLTQGSLGALSRRLESSPDLGLVAPRLVSPDGTEQFSWSPDRSLLGEALQRLRNRHGGKPWNHGLVERLLRLVFGQGWYSGACLLIRRRAFEQVSGFDPAYFLYFEDVDLCLRLRAAGWKLAREDAAEVVHVGGPGTRDDAVELHYRQSQLYYYSTHRPRWEEERLWLRIVDAYQEGPIARWLGHGGQPRPLPPDPRELVEEVVEAGVLPKTTTRRLSRCLEELSDHGEWRETVGD